MSPTVRGLLPSPRMKGERPSGLGWYQVTQQPYEAPEDDFVVLATTGDTRLGQARLRFLRPPAVYGPNNHGGGVAHGLHGQYGA